MGNISVSLPNLISGVSQQPPALRLATSSEADINVWPSVVSGLNKRFPTEHVANLSSIITSDTAIGHIIDKGAGYQYIVVAADGRLRVLDTAGVEYTVNAPNDWAYISQSADALSSLRFLTFGDTTFVMNRDIIVGATNFGEEAISITPNGTVATFSALPTAGVGNLNQIYFVTAESRYYKCIDKPPSAQLRAWQYDGVTQATVPSGTIVDSLPDPVSPIGTIVWLRKTRTTTYGGTSTSYARYKSVESSPAQGGGYTWETVTGAESQAVINGRYNPAFLGTVHVTNSVANASYGVYINNVLRASFSTGTGEAGNPVQSTSAICSQLRTGLVNSGYTVTLNGSTLTIMNLQPDDTLKVWGSNGDRALKCYRGSVGQFSDLPPNEIVGRIVKVKGDVMNAGDDYYVIFNSENLWVETVGFNQGGGLNPSTMPHILRREQNGTWTFKQHKWEVRIAGDTKSNPMPSFVGYKFNDIFVYSNRLGLIADQNIILSETDTFENFFRTTLATLIDSDVLDFSVIGNDDTLRHCTPFNKDLLILADRSQHRFVHNNFVGPKNVAVQYTTSFPVSPTVRPVNMGNSIYFLDDADGYEFAKLMEYFPKENYAGDDAEDSTASVPQFVRTGVRFIAASPRINVALLNSENEPSTMYVYKFFWAGNKKVQNAWVKWEFDDCAGIMWADFLGSWLYMLIKRPAGVFLEKMQIDEDITDDITRFSKVMLDRQATPTASYNSGTNRTTLTFPYVTNAAKQAVSVAGDGSLMWLTTTVISTNQVTVVGNLTGHTIRAGIPYTKVHKFSTPYVRIPKGQGEIVALDARFQVRYMKLEYHNTDYFKVYLKHNNRSEENVIQFAGKERNGSLRVPVWSNHLNFQLRIENDTPFNSSFGNAEFHGTYQPKSKMIG
jgi:hypothetical protein